MVPLELCQRHQAVAFGVRTAGDVQTVYIALADPYDSAAMDAIRARVRGAVKFALAPAGEVARAISRAVAERAAALSREPEPAEPPPAASLYAVPLPAPATPRVPLPGLQQAPPPAIVPLPAPEAPNLGAPAARDDGRAALDNLLGLGPNSVLPAAPPPPAFAAEVLDDLFDGGESIAEPAPSAPSQGVIFETEADVFDLSTQAEAVGAYSAQLGRLGEAYSEPQPGFLMGEALLDSGRSPASLSLEGVPRLDSPGDLDFPDAVLPGIELTAEEIAQEAANEWPPEASAWAEEPSFAAAAFDSPALGLSHDPAGAPALSSQPAVEDQDPFSEPTRQFDLTTLNDQLRGAAAAGAPPNEAARDDGFNLFVAKDEKAEARAAVSEPLPAPVPLQADFGVHGLETLPFIAAEPAEPALAKPSQSSIALPDLESLRAELTAYSTEYGAAKALAPDAGEPSAQGGVGPLDLDFGDAPAASAPVSADSRGSSEAPARGAALPPPPNLTPVSLAPEPAAPTAGGAVVGEPIEISSDEIIDVEPDAAAGAPAPESAPSRLFDEASLASFGGELGGPTPASEGSPAPLPTLPRSSGPSLVPSSAHPDAPVPPADVLENLRRMASSGPLAPGMTAYAPDHLGHALAKALSAREVVSGGELADMMALPADQLSLQLVRTLLARAMLTADDLVSMLTTPQERLNAAVLARLLESGAVGADELLRAL